MMNAQIFAPGQWRCPKCKFRLTQSVLSMSDGEIYANDRAGGNCPNCDSPLWRVSWEEDAREAYGMVERAWGEKSKAEAERDEALAQVAALRDLLSRIAACDEGDADLSEWGAIEIVNRILADTAGSHAYRARIRTDAFREILAVALKSTTVTQIEAALNAAIGGDNG